MPRFRLTIRKTEVSHQVVELDASDVVQASVRGNRFIDGQRRGATVVQPFDDDSRATELQEIIAVREA